MEWGHHERSTEQQGPVESGTSSSRWIAGIDAESAGSEYAQQKIGQEGRTMLSDTLIRFTVCHKKTGELRPCWVKGCSFEDGPGMKTKVVTRTFDRKEAGRFYRQTAYAIAKQFFQHEMLALEDARGNVLQEETEKLRAEQKVLFGQAQVALFQYAQAEAVLASEVKAIIQGARR